MLNRRDFLKWAGVTGAILANGAALGAFAQSGHTHPPTERPGYSYPVGNKMYPWEDPETGEWLFHEKIRFAPRPGLARTPLTQSTNLLDHQPPRIESKDGVLTVDLDVQFADLPVNGQICNLRTYNGRFPAPTLVAKPGDILRVRQINNLPPEAPMPHHNINHPHGFNDINFHTHGLNVNPEDSEDNVLLTIHPGEIFEHEIHVSADHPTGTFWYHPHKHGASACHLASGMAGALLLTDPDNDIRSIPEIAAAQEVLLIFQEIYIKDRPEDGVGEVPGMPTDVAEFFYSDVIRSEQTVNGLACNEIGMDGSVIIPEIRMRPGEVQHWRMIHGGIFQNWHFGIDGHQSHIVAYDGMTLEAMETVDEFLFVSGQRRDILVQASTTPGTYAVKRRAYKQAPEANTWPEITLFNLIVEGEPASMSLPTKLNPPSARLPYITDDEVIYKREVAFSFFDNTAKGIFLFTTNNRIFKPGRIDFSMVKDTAEEWTIVNNPASDHPFHIHVNWFQVMKIVDGAGNETIYDPPIWMDTVNVPGNGSVVMRMRLENYQGVAVFHCHFLMHEDEGMMSTIEIVDGSPKTATITADGGTFVSSDYANRVQMRFHKGTVAADTEITYQYNASPNVPTVNPAPALAEGLADYNTFFTISAVQGGAPITEFNRPVTMEVKYSAAQVDVDVPMSDIYLYHYDEAAGAWTNEGVSIIARASNLLTCSTKKVGTFAVSGLIEHCLDFAEPAGVGPEDIVPILETKDSPYDFFKAPYDVVKDGVLDDKDLMEVINAQGQFCAE